MFLITFFADWAITRFDLQYDDSAIGTVLILGHAIYAFPFYIVAEILVGHLPIAWLGTVVNSATLAILYLLDLLITYIIELHRRKNKRHIKTETIKIRLRKKEIVILIIIITLMGLAKYDLYLAKAKEIAKRDVYETFTSINYLQYRVLVYKKNMGFYPDNILELKDFIDEKDPYMSDNIYVDFELELDYEHFEKHTLDGSGGLYYNNETGEIRVNLDRPVKYYEPNSPIRRDEIPAKW